LQNAKVKDFHEITKVSRKHETSLTTRFHKIIFYWTLDTGNWTLSYSGGKMKLFGRKYKKEEVLKKVGGISQVCA